MNRRDFISVTALTSAALAQEPRKARMKITVLKNTVQKDFQKYHEFQTAACMVVKPGQEFLVHSASEMPKGMCSWAWDDMRKNMEFVDKGQVECTVSCCTDGFRPVFFLIERVG